MRPVERDCILLLLAATAGSSDAWSYIGLGHAFVANMTGNTVLIGLALFQMHGDLLHPLLSLCGYVAGTLTGSLLVRNTPPQSTWPRRIFLALLIEALALGIAACEWRMPHNAASHTRDDALLALLACAIGIQSGVMVRLRIPGIVTTYITGTWTTLVSGLSRVMAKTEIAHETIPLAVEKRLLLQAAVIGFYLGAASLSGLLFRYAPAAVGALPFVPLLLVSAYGLIRTGRIATR